MRKEKIVKILVEEFANLKFKNCKSYKKYQKFHKTSNIFWNTLTENQKDIYLKCEEYFWDYNNLKEEEIIEFVRDFCKSIN